LFILVLFNNKWEFGNWSADESVWINGPATEIYLGLFLCFAEYSIRRTTPQTWVPTAATYLGVMTIVGILDEYTVGVKWLCMIAGVASDPHAL
jgi:hypothetical protein